MSKPTISITHDFAFTAWVGATEQTVFADYNALHAGILNRGFGLCSPIFPTQPLYPQPLFILNLILAAAI